jgi:hypothetical protein
MDGSSKRCSAGAKHHTPRRKATFSYTALESRPCAGFVIFARSFILAAARTKSRLCLPENEFAFCRPRDKMMVNPKKDKSGKLNCGPVEGREHAKRD